MFLENSEFTARPLTSKFKDLQPIEFYLGQGTNALEIIILESRKTPATLVIQNAYTTRKSGRATPVLIVIKYNDQFFLCGPTGEKPNIINTKDSDFVKRICISALRQSNRNNAINFVMDCFTSIDSDLLGIVNQGLLSNHELSHGTKKRADWKNATNNSENVIGKTNKDLLISLGFTSKPLDNLTELLTDIDERTALAVLLNDNELPESTQERFNNLSPVSYALTKADKERLPWVIFIQEDKIRLYSTQNIGVGRRGRTESYIQCQTSMLSKSNQALLWLIFSSKALKKDGTIDEILSESKRFASDIADKLRERIYDTVIPELAMGIVKAQNLKKPTSDSIQLIYEMTLTILFRLLFIAYAEDRDFLPYKTNEIYRARSLKNKAIELSKNSSNKILEPNISNHWSETNLLFEAIYKGNKEWGIPTYDGTIFSNKKSVSKAGEEISKLTLPNSCFEIVLKSLLLDNVNTENLLPVDFRSLSVREFGTIYEGLLESELSIAEQNLTLDKEGNYHPTDKEDEIIINLGEIYLHDKSGARKSSGSFYTRDFAVEYLLDGALEPALDKHLEEMKGLDSADRIEKFFNFYVADIAMGSGHFLVAAIDRIERRFALWLNENKTSGIYREIQDLRKAAYKELGELGESITIDDGQLLRRLIARRCIYGVDLNPLSVQLARLSVWIHTFVPGLPLSLLDHNFVNGNSLVGVATLDEIKKKFEEKVLPLFPIDAENLLGKAKEPLKKLARISESSITDINSSRMLINEAKKKIKETEALCDLIIAQPIAEQPLLKNFNFDEWEKKREQILNSEELKLAKKILEPLSILHFPIAFPEVFLNRSNGFNVILGNPPWEVVKVEEKKFWTRYFPGLMGKSQQEYEEFKLKVYQKRPDLVLEYSSETRKQDLNRKIINSGNYPGISTGDIDLYKAFCWRFWHVTSNYLGKIGVVLPRSAFAAKGSANFRKKLFTTAKYISVTTLHNTGKWVFDIDPRYTISLICLSKDSGDKKGIELKGPFNSLNNFLNGITKPSFRFTSKEILEWNEDGSLPMLPSNDSTEVFLQLRKSPWISSNISGEWFVKPRVELHASSDKHLMDLKNEIQPSGFWPVYKGLSFDLWEPDKGKYYAWGDPSIIKPHLENKEKKRAIREGNNYKLKIHAENPRISFRLVTNRTNTRTLIVALTPPKCFQQHSVQFLELIRGNKIDEAFILGCLSSIPLDWYARRFVELNFTFNYFNALPIPRPDKTKVLYQRVVELSARLASTDKRFKNWASDIGVEYGFLESEEKLKKIYELDAVVSHLYGLTESQLIHIYETFHESWDYNDRLNQVLDYYNSWENKK